MKRIFSLIVLMCMYLIPIFSQVDSHIKTNTPFGNSIVVIDSRPFSVMNKDFKNSLISILNERNLLISESSEKDMNFQYRIVRELEGNQSYYTKPRMTTVRYIPNSTQSYNTKPRIITLRGDIQKNFHIQVPEIGNPLLIRKL